MCEYCQIGEDDSVLPLELDHIRAKKHHGPKTLQNTCVACAHCNVAKGSDATGYDPLTDDLVRLFNPRTDDWKDYFFWDGPILHGKTAIARATIELLRINASGRIELRRLLLKIRQAQSRRKLSSRTHMIRRMRTTQG